MRLQNLLEWGAKELKNCTEDAISETRYLIEGVLEIERSRQYIEADREINNSDMSLFNAALERRKKAEPLAMIIGYKEFYGRKFEVNQETLIPRDDSEILVDTVFSYCRVRGNPEAIIELGTGSGCLLISILSELSETDMPEAIAIDKSSAALKVAQSNAKKYNLFEKISWREQDWRENLAVYKQDIMIISNPPYVRTGDIPNLEASVRDYESRLALDGGEDGLRAIREILSRPNRWAENELLFLEVGYDQAESAISEAQKYGWSCLETCRDLRGVDRLIVCQIKDRTIKNT